MSASALPVCRSSALRSSVLLRARGRGETIRALLSWLPPPSGLRAEGPPSTRATLGAGTRPGTACDAEVDDPPGLLPSLQRFRSRGSAPRGASQAPATFRPRRFSRPRRLTPPGTFRASRPGNAPGIRDLQGFAPPGRLILSRGRSSPAVPLAGASPFRTVRRRGSAPEACAARESVPPPASREARRTAVPLLVFIPFKALRSSAAARQPGPSSPALSRARS